MHTPYFIIGTGRCGSTLLSSMLAQHSEILVLNEFMNGTRPVDVERQTGVEFARHLAKSNPILDLVLHRGSFPGEVTVEKVDMADLSSVSPPAALVATLPALTEDTVGLLRESLEAVAAFPTQPRAAHIRQYFEWLQTRLGKTMWVERSGNSLEILPHMVRMFPDAKYIHLQREGIETALSMREHDYFRLYASYFFNPWTEEELDRTELGQQPIGPDDPITYRMRGAGVPTAEQFGLFWSHAVEVAYPELLKMAPGTRLDITYEDLLASPNEVLAAIGEFCEFPAEDGWIERAAALLGSPPPARFPKLDPADQAGVHRGCFAGRYLLGQVEQRPWSNDAFASVYDRYERFGVANPFLAAMRERDM